MSQATPLKTTTSSASRRLYINTIVFAVIAAVVSLALLAVIIFVADARTFAYSIVTFEVGLIIIIIAAIVQIVRYEKRLRKEAEQGNAYIVNVDTCPDYFSNVFNNMTLADGSKIVTIRGTYASPPPFCSDSGAMGVTCNAGVLGSDEKFIMEPSSLGANGSCNAGVSGSKEKFITDASPNIITLKGPKSNKYATVVGNQVICNAEKPGLAQEFILTRIGNGKVTLQNNQTKKYCTVGISGMSCIAATKGVNEELLWSESTPTPEQANRSGVQCANGYLNPQGTRRYFFVKRGCTSTSDVNDPQCALDSKVMNDAYRINLNDYTNTTSIDLCQRVNTTDMNQVFSNLPWTDIKANCNSLSLGDAFTN